MTRRTLLALAILQTLSVAAVQAQDVTVTPPAGGGFVVNNGVSSLFAIDAAGRITIANLGAAATHTSPICFDVASGVLGPCSNAGLVGPTGAPGPIGPVGPTGATGNDGAIGITGATGATGAMGVTGASGVTGATGPIGDTGSTGATGATGVTGAMGSIGPAGPIGPVGPTGVDGAVGATGPIGPTGADGAGSASGTTNYVSKFTGASTLGNSQIRDDGTSVAINAAPSNLYQAYIYDQQLTADGLGQASIFGYRTRDSQNIGTGYGQFGGNSAVKGFNYWGDEYTFGVAGFSYNDYTRTGGVLGADVTGIYWGSLGYKNSASGTYGVYGSAGYASGAGRPEGPEKEGIGGGFYGSMIGSWSHGEVMGAVSSGSMFATYNLGNVYTSGYSVDLVASGNEVNAPRVAAFANTSTGLKVYDNGSAQLNGESVFVPFTTAYSGMLGAVPDVTVSPVGSPAQLYILSIERNGFTVAVASGTANVRFSWIAVGNRSDADKVKALPVEIANGSFDSKLLEVMGGEGDLSKSARPIWFDGEKVRFDAAPQPPAQAKQELQ